jgi:hypothetical protein
MKQFSEKSLNRAEWSRSTPYWFEAAMLSTCGEEAFPGCYDNYEVEDALRKAGVIRKNNQTDTESCALVINFSSKSAGLAFIERLNKYLATR